MNYAVMSACLLAIAFTSSRVKNHRLMQTQLQHGRDDRTTAVE